MLSWVIEPSDPLVAAAACLMAGWLRRGQRPGQALVGGGVCGDASALVMAIDPRLPSWLSVMTRINGISHRSCSGPAHDRAPRPTPAVPGGPVRAGRGQELNA